MPADVIKFGEHPPGTGGEFEREVVLALRDNLPSHCLLLVNPSFPTWASFFYEYDIIILSPLWAIVVEIKKLIYSVDVYEDWLEGINQYKVPSVFSKLENKTKVFNSKLREQFHWVDTPWIKDHVLVGPENIKVNFKFKKHKENSKVLKLQEALEYYKTIDAQLFKTQYDKYGWESLKQKLKGFSENLQENCRKKNKIGRFLLKRRVSDDFETLEYLAIDEPPCPVDVRLIEYPFDPVLSKKQLEGYLKAVSREMVILRGLRHQFINCAIGHFQTGCSLVQVNDWFEGKPLSNLWSKMGEIDFITKLGLMVKVLQGIGYCHIKGVFHRNISSKNILIDCDFEDLRITGFRFAKDIELTQTMTSTGMQNRDSKIIPPEELVRNEDINYRLYDIYQLGVLFYQILENGEYPFEDVFDYMTAPKDQFKISFNSHFKESGMDEMITLVKSMLKVNPSSRPNLVEKIEGEINSIICSV